MKTFLIIFNLFLCVTFLPSCAYHTAKAGEKKKQVILSRELEILYADRGRLKKEEFALKATRLKRQSELAELRKRSAKLDQTAVTTSRPSDFSAEVARLDAQIKQDLQREEQLRKDIADRERQIAHLSQMP